MDLTGKVCQHGDVNVGEGVLVGLVGGRRRKDLARDTHVSFLFDTRGNKELAGQLSFLL